MKHNEHHKKLDNKIPSWLYFALHDFSGNKKTGNLFKIILNVIKSAIRHKKERNLLGAKMIWKPNNYDCAGMYSRCPCPKCIKNLNSITPPSTKTEI